MMMRIALQLAKINLLQLVRDRRSLFVFIVMPIMLIAILSSAFSGVFGGKGIPKFTVAVVNQDEGAMGAQLESFLASQSSQMSVHQVATVTAARQQTEKGTAAVVVTIPTDYTAQLQADHQTTVGVEASLNHDTQKSATEGIVQAYGQQLGLMKYVQQQSVATSHPVRVQGVTIHQEDAGMDPISSGAYYAIGMMVMFMLTNALSRSAIMVAQQESDLHHRMVAAPASRYALTIGHWLSNFLVVLVQGGILLLMARWLLNIHFGPVTQTIVLLAGYAFSLSGLSIALGSLLKNAQATNSLSNIGAQIAAVLGGSIFPIYNFPHVMQVIAHILPNGIIITAMVDSVMGISNTQLLLPLLYLIAIGLLLGIVASTRYGRRLA